MATAAHAATWRDFSSLVFQRGETGDGFVSREVHDIDRMVDEQDDGVGGDYVQLDSRPFCARWLVFTLPRLVLRFTREDVGSLHRICAPIDKWLVFIPLRGIVRWDGCAVTPDCQIVCPPSSESLVCHGGGTEFAIVSVGAPGGPSLVDAIRAKLPAVATAQVIHPPPNEIRTLAADLIGIRARLTLSPETMTRPDMVAETEFKLHQNLDRCVRDALVDRATRGTVRSRGSIVKQAEAFVREHLGEAVSISQLSVEVGVSERSLRNAFYQVCATSPKKYMRLWQLHQVRRTLLSAPTDHSAVTAAATRHGFFELGRFSSQYRRVFGEAPSVTLHRARREPTLSRPSAH